jgi:putative transposase
MKRFKSARHVQRFASILDPIYNLHHFPRNQFNSTDHRKLCQAATDMWGEIACVKSA